MNTFPTGNAERILASQIQEDIAVNTETTLTLQAAQPMWVDLSRLCFQAFTFSEQAASGSSPTRGDLNPMTRISSIQLRGAYELVRGSSSPVVPATALGPSRNSNFFRFNGSRWMSLASGETIKITYTSANADYKSTVSAGIPCVLKCDVGLVAIPAGIKAADGAALIGTAAQSTAVAGNKAASTLTFAFDEAGTMDLTNVVANFISEETYAGAKNNNEPIDYGVNTVISSLKLVDSSQIIVGNAGSSSLAVPALMFGSPSGPMDREHPWALLQAQQGSAGSEVVLQGTTYSPQAAAGKIAAWAGAPFYAKGGVGPGGICQ